MRSFDHREAGGVRGMQEAIAAGYIRYMPEFGSFEIGREPTPAQYKQLARLVQHHRGYVGSELSPGLGEKAEHHYDNHPDTQSIEYKVGTRPEQVVGDIKKYYTQGPGTTNNPDSPKLVKGPQGQMLDPEDHETIIREFHKAGKGMSGLPLTDKESDYVDKMQKAAQADVEAQRLSVRPGWGDMNEDSITSRIAAIDAHKQAREAAWGEQHAAYHDQQIEEHRAQLPVRKGESYLLRPSPETIEEYPELGRWEATDATPVSDLQERSGGSGYWVDYGLESGRAFVKPEELVRHIGQHLHPTRQNMAQLEALEHGPMTPKELTVNSGYPPDILASHWREYLTGKDAEGNIVNYVQLTPEGRAALTLGRNRMAAETGKGGRLGRVPFSNSNSLPPGMLHGRYGYTPGRRGAVDNRIVPGHVIEPFDGIACSDELPSQEQAFRNLPVLLLQYRLQRVQEAAKRGVSPKDILDMISRMQEVHEQMLSDQVLGPQQIQQYRNGTGMSDNQRPTFSTGPHRRSVAPAIDAPMPRDYYKLGNLPVGMRRL